MSEGHETRIRLLEIATASHAAETSSALKHIVQAVDELKETVQELRDSMNQGKGAIRGATWLWGIVAGGVGAVASWAMTHIFRSP